MKAIRAISNFLAQFDYFSAPATLRIRDDDKMTNSSIGFFSLLISGLFIYIFINGCIGIIQYQQIQATMQDTVPIISIISQVIPQADAVGHLATLAVGIDNLTIQQIDSMFLPLQSIVVDLTIGNYWSYMVPCTPEMWAGLGENYNATFQESGINNMYCINYTSPVRLNQTMVSWTATNLVIEIFICDLIYEYMTDSCDYRKAYRYIRQNKPQIHVYLLDAGFNPQQKQSVTPFVNTDSKIVLLWKRTSILQIEYSSYRIQTDQNLVTFSTNSSINGMWVNSIRNYIRPYDPNYAEDDLGKITVFMNQNLRIYKRTVGKLDNLFSYVGELFQILIGFIAYFIGSFNQYRYQLRVSEGAFDFNKNGRKIKESDMSFKTFIIYGVYDWINTFLCINLKWKLCNQIDQIREQIISQMEVNRFYKRIANAETEVTYALGQDQMDFIKLVQPPSKDKVKTRLLKLNYYDQIAAKDTYHGNKQKQIEKNILDVQKDTKQNQSQMRSEEIKKEQENKIKQKAQAIILTPQQLEIEKQFTNSLFALNPNQRNQIQKKINPIIMQRLKLTKSQTIS